MRTGGCRGCNPPHCRNPGRQEGGRHMELRTRTVGGGEQHSPVILEAQEAAELHIQQEEGEEQHIHVIWEPKEAAELHSQQEEDEENSQVILGLQESDGQGAEEKEAPRNLR